MRNLKKILALVLALMMVLSVMVTTSAADETDAIVYQEAADLTQALKIVDGTDNGYDPNGLFTREQAATLLARVTMGRTAANALVTAGDPFTDVKATHWGAGAIAWAANEGYIVGVGDGSFNPTGILDGYGWLKLLLCAIGYGDPADYTGSNWKLATINAAKAAGLLATMPAGYNYGDQITRDYAMELAFTAMKAGTTTTYYAVVVGTIADPSATAQDVTDPTKIVNVYTSLMDALTMKALLGNTGYDIDTYVVSANLLTDVHKVATANYQDELGRPGMKWYKQADTNKKAITIVMNDLINSWSNEGITRADVWAELADSTTAKTATFAVDAYTNGAVAWDGVSIANDKTAKITHTGKGTVAELYESNEQGVDAVLVIVQEFSGVVTALVQDDVTTTDDETAVKIGDLAWAGTGFEVGDRVLYTKNETKILTMTAHETVEGKATLIDGTTGTVTFADATYSYSLNHGEMISTIPSAKADNSVLYLDSFGNIMYVGGIEKEEVEAVYGIVLQVKADDVTSEGDLFDATTTITEYYAQLLMADGTVATVKFAATEGGTADWTKASEGGFTCTADTKNALVTYTVKENGTYVLKDAEAPNGDLNKDLVVTDPSVTINVTDSTAYYKTNSKTQFVLQETVKVNNVDTTVYNVYTGFAKVPQLDADATGEDIDNESVWVIPAEDGYAQLVFILNGTKLTSEPEPTADTIFVDVSSAKQYVDAKGAYVTYLAVIGGKIETIVVAQPNEGAPALPEVDSFYTNYTKNDDGRITAWTKSETFSMTAAELVFDVTEGFVLVDGVASLTKANSIVYVVTDSGITEYTVADYAATEVHTDKYDDTFEVVTVGAGATAYDVYYVIPGVAPQA